MRKKASREERLATAKAARAKTLHEYTLVMVSGDSETIQAQALMKHEEACAEVDKIIDTSKKVRLAVYTLALAIIVLNVLDIMM